MRWTALARAVAAAGILLLAACGGSSGPAPLDTKNEACASCRMGVVDRRFAAQLVAPGHEPLFFDDLGCLVSWLQKPHEKGSFTTWVSDHRTKEWTLAATAVYTRQPKVQTPMSSGLLAHADTASRDRDPACQGGTPVTATEAFGPDGPPRGSR